jgi:hypothetical protein
MVILKLILAEIRLKKTVLLSKLGKERIQACVPIILENIHKFVTVEITEDNDEDLSFLVEIGIKPEINDFIKPLINTVIQELKDEFK